VKNKFEENFRFYDIPILYELSCPHSKLKTLETFVCVPFTWFFGHCTEHAKFLKRREFLDQLSFFKNILCHVMGNFPGVLKYIQRSS